jgi:hypothetical protein
MFMSVRHYENVSSTSGLGQRFRDDFAPMISAVPGFVGYYLTDGGNGKVQATSIFDTKANAEESNRVAADWLTKNPGVLPTASHVTTGEIIGDKTKASTGIR